MDEEVDRGSVAFHIVMALLSDLALHDEPRLARMADTLARILDGLDGPSDCADVRFAYDALLRFNAPPQRR